MESLILRSLIGLYAVFALVKFAVFFTLNYQRRRQALDRAYDGKASATKVSDEWTLLFVVALALLLAFHGVDYVSFLTGLLIGSTLIQLYFHRFSVPLEVHQTPSAPLSPIKLMSYAIQAGPARPWKEIAVMTALFVWSLYGIIFAGH